MLAGSLIGYLIPIIGAFHMDPWVCILSDFAGHLAFALIYGFLIAKTWRIHSLFVTATEQVKKKITVTDMSSRVSVYCVVILVLMILKYTVYEYREDVFVESIDTNFSSGTKTIVTCKMCRYSLDTSIFSAKGVLFNIPGIAVIACHTIATFTGLYYAFVSRNLREKIGDSKATIFSLYLSAFLYMLLFVSQSSLGTCDSKYFVYMLFIILAFTVMSLLFCFF